MDLNKFFAEFEALCKQTVTEVADKFIDLNVEDNTSAYGHDMQSNQEKYRKALNKVAFKFETHVFDLPKGHAESVEDEMSTLESTRHKLEEDLQAESLKMSKDLEGILNILNVQAVQTLSHSNIIVEHSWNS